MRTKPQFPENESCDPLAPMRGLLLSAALGSIAWGAWWGVFAWLLNR